MIKQLLNILLVFVILTSCKKEKDYIFNEEFDGKTLNESYWNYELGDGCPNICGWGNNERQIYTKENATLRNGHLVITATKDSTLYQSARITTANKIEFQYGTIEVRAKLPLGHGLWPAIWMLGNDISSISWPACGEIDIMEYVGRAPHEVHTTLHTNDSYGKSINTKVTTIETIEDGFHIYKSNWTKDKIEFFIDGTLVYTFNPELKNDNTWPFNKPYFIILNLAIGGDFGGPEVDDSIFPQEFIIDYVRVFKN